MNRREQSNFENWLGLDDDADDDDDFDVVTIVRDEGLEEIEVEFQKKLARLEGEFERKKKDLLAERERKRKNVLKIARSNSRSSDGDAGGTGSSVQNGIVMHVPPSAKPDPVPEPFDDSALRKLFPGMYANE